MSLVEFLLARIGEDEEAALNASHHSYLVRDYERDNYGFLWVKTTRVRRECEAKRRIVELHGGSWGMCTECGHGEDGSMFDESGWFSSVPHPCPTLRHLTAVYADHPDYRQEWKP